MAVLIVVQGITGKDYILNDVIDYLNLGYPDKDRLVWRNKKDGYTYISRNSKHRYKAIVSIDTERCLWKWSPLGLLDRGMDYVIGNLGAIEKVRGEILEVIRYFTREYGETEYDGIGHSYGGQTIAGVDYPFRNVVVCGAPMTSSIPLVGWWTKKELQDNAKVRADNLFYLWNEHDPVCKQPLIYPGVVNIKAAKGHTFFNRGKQLHHCYLPECDQLLNIKV